MEPRRSPYAVPLAALVAVPVTAEVVVQPEPTRPVDRLDGGGDVDGDGDGD